MPWYTPAPVAGNPITSAWGNAVENAAVPQFATFAALNAGWSDAPEGALAVVTADYIIRQRRGGAWQTLLPNRYGAGVTSSQSIPNNAFTNVNNFTTQTNSGGAAPSAAGVTMPAVPGTAAVSLRAESATAVPAGTILMATVFINGSYSSMRATIPPAGTLASTAQIYPVDSPNAAWSVQWYNNTGGAVTCQTTLTVYQVAL